LWFYH